jgi:hypothetical protein
MAVLALVISIIALICAYVAYRKSGSLAEDLKRTVEDFGLSTETFRNRTADMLGKLEKKVRGEEKKSVCHPDTKEYTQQNGHG